MNLGAKPKPKPKPNNIVIGSEGAKFSMMDFHLFGPDRSKPMGRQQSSLGPGAIPDSCGTCRVSKEVRNLAQRVFRKIHTLIENPLYKEMSCPSRLGLLKRIPIRKKLDRKSVV